MARVKYLVDILGLQELYAVKYILNYKRSSKKMMISLENSSLFRDILSSRAADLPCVRCGVVKVQL